MSSTRNTTQRLKILEYLRSVKTHPNVEEVYQAVRKEMPMISLATVYRNLNMLAEQGEILRIDSKGETRFDGDTCYHEHCICERCGKVVDIMTKNVSEYAMHHFKSKDFVPKCVMVIYSGQCKKCTEVMRHDKTSSM